MTLYALVLAISSAIFHSIWNYLIKRSVRPDLFISLLLLCASVFTLPLFILEFFTLDASAVDWYAIAIACVFETIYVLSLAESYRGGKLSIAYPVSRSIPPVLLILTPIFVFEGAASFQGFFGVGVVLLGIYAMFAENLFGSPQSFFKGFNTRSNWAAVISGISISVYSIFYKVALQQASVIFVLSLTFWVMAIVSTAISLKQTGYKTLKQEWLTFKWSIIAAGIICYGSFVLLLFAMKEMKLTYLSSIRNLSIVFTALLGVFVLKESVSRAQWIGIAIIFVGCTIIALA